jgi:hypothetical protein
MATKQSATEFIVSPAVNGVSLEHIDTFPVSPTLLTRLGRRHVLGYQTLTSLALGQGAVGGNVTVFLPHYSDKARTITSVQINVAALYATGQADLALYTHSEEKGADTPIGSTSFNTTSSGLKTNTVSWDLPAGLSWLALRVNNTTNQFTRPNATSAATGTWGYGLTGVTSSLVATTNPGTYQIAEPNSSTFSAYTGGETVAVSSNIFPFVTVQYA